MAGSLNGFSRAYACGFLVDLDGSFVAFDVYDFPDEPLIADPYYFVHLTTKHAVGDDDWPCDPFDLSGFEGWHGTIL